ncbi:MAG: hypothetical protein ABIO44_03550 [Saprospiraceae bacterium]
MIFRSSLILILLLWLNSIHSQRIFFVSSRSDFSLYEWALSDSLDEEIGSLDFARLPNDAFNTWNIRIGEISGFLKLRWKENPHEWDLRLGNDLISIKPVWPNQFDQWNMTLDGHNLNLSLRRDKEGLQWIVSTNSRETVLEIINDVVNDPRDWSLYYYKPLENNSMSVAALFIAATYSRLFK